MTPLPPTLAFLLAASLTAFLLRRQLEFGWLGLAFYGILAGLAGVEAARVYPAYQDYWHVQQILAATPKAPGFSEMSPADLRADFDARARQLKVATLAGKDLDITRGPGGFAVSASYQVVVPVYGNLKLGLDFEASTPESKPTAGGD